jgi:tRNA pseudouridine38-40 synthase
LVCRFAHHEPKPLDIDRMNAGARLLVGEHDFASFGQPTHGDSTVRQVYDAVWRWPAASSPGAGDAGHLLQFEIEANAFLRRMVRTIVGTLLEVGKGYRSVESVAQVLGQRDRALAAPPAAACGLSLTEVKY